MNILQIVAYLAELLTAISATAFFYKYRNTHLKYFSFYLWYVIINEILFYFLLRQDFVFIKHQLTNIYGLITIIFVLWMCSKYIELSRLKNIIYVLISASIIIFLTEYIYKGFNEVWVISKTTGALLCIVAFAIYISGLFQSNKTTNPFRQLFTYFLIGFSLFFVASPVILITRKLFIDNDKMSNSMTYLMGSIAILMYGIFCAGFIISKKEENLVKNNL